jgi:hypothetical protein
MPRLEPPSGFVTLKDAVALLHKLGVKVSDTMIYKYVEQGRLQRYGPSSRKQKYYSIEEIEALAESELAFHSEQAKKGIDATFARATLDDMEEVTRVAGKLFRTPTLTPIPASTRRAWMTKEPWGHYVVKKKKNGEVVAYLHIVALTDDRIQAYMADEIRGRDIIGDDVQQFVADRPISCIVVSIGTDPDIRPKETQSNYVAVLLRGVRADIEELGQQGIIIPRLYAYSESKKGVAMCALMGMQQYAPPVGRRYTFWLDMLHSSEFLVQGYQRGLAEWRQQHGE